MGKKKENVFKQLVDDLVNDSVVESTEREILDVITFCEHPHYLNFLGQDPPLNLWPMQKIVLKLFYRGTKGNKHLQLDDTELAILDDITKNEELDYENDYGGFQQVIDKYKRGNIHNLMLLIMGRRSSKTMMVSIIAAYEAYKLLETPEGNPHKYYKLSPDKPIAILNVAVSESQALDPLFKEIKSRLARSPYFENKINHDKTTLNQLYLLTDADKRENSKRRAQGSSIMVDGSVVLKSGHSNSASLRGQAAICILFDEFAHFMSSSGKSSGDEVFNALVPSTKQFGLDGKVVLLSDPRGKDGMFWKLFQMAQAKEKLDDGSEVPTNDEIIALQIPTWRMNPTESLSKENLERTERVKNAIAFNCSWGARFQGEAGDKLFDERRVIECVNLAYKEPPMGSPMYTYYMHLDPATTSHNYALALAHVVTYRINTGEIRKKVFVDKIKYWRPSKGVPVDINAVEKEIRDLCRKFRVAQVSFDSFASQPTIQRLQMCGIRAIETPFTATYISAIYGELKNLINQGEIELPNDQLLVGEMKNLRFKIVSRGIKRFFDPQSEYPSDDCCDAVASCSWQALYADVKMTLPRSVLVRGR